VLLSAALLMAASSVTGQTPPPQIGQDELDLQARANVVQGSGARALGMGGAFLARADDATAASWNPAGLSYLRLPEVSFVYSGSHLDSVEVDSTSRKDDRRHGHTPDFFAAAYPFELGRVSGSAQVSFQRLISFEGERTINETFLDESGQAASSLPSVVTSAGGYDVVTLGTGVAVSTNLRVGATVNRWFNGYHQTLDRDTLRGGIPGHTTQEFDYDFSAWNLNLGLMWSPHTDFNLGLVYKSAFTADVQLNKTRHDLGVPSSDNQASSTDPGMSPITLDFPAAIGVGGSWRPRSRLTLSADYTRSFWSKGVIRNFFSLPQARPGPGTPTTYPSLPYPSLSSQPQHDTVQVRGGVEFVFIFGRVKLPVRAGGFSDRQYVEALDGTPPHFTGLTAGTGVVIGPVLLDVAFIRERGNYLAGTTPPGTAVSVKSRRLVGSMIIRFPRH
jgi:hypothetical protein